MLITSSMIIAIIGVSLCEPHINVYFNVRSV